MSNESRSILIVDDEENVLSALRRSLRREGYSLMLSTSPAEALEMLAKTPADIVLSDHLMPKMTGLAFLKIVRDRFPDTMRMMLTGHADMQTAIEGINQGQIYRFLTKPWDDNELKVTLQLALGQLDLQRENRRLVTMVRSQGQVLHTLEKQHPGIASLTRDSTGAILIDSEDKTTPLV